MNKRTIGKIGEDIACNYLKENSYDIIERNFNSKQGEIDIIAKDIKSKEVVFIEVKTRNTKRFGRGLEAINRNKMTHIINTAKYYLYINRLQINTRFDVIEVYTKDKKINHVKQIL